MRMVITKIILVVCLFGSINLSHAFEYVWGTDVYPTPAVSKPELGDSFIEPNFNTTVTRLSDVANEPNADHRVAMRNDYSKMTAINCNNTIVMLRSGGGYMFYYTDDLSYIRKGNWSDMAEPRWSNKNPHIVYGHGPFNATMWTFNVITGVKTQIHDFNDDYPDVTIRHARTRDEGDCSIDDRYWALTLDTPDNTHYKIIVYDMKTDTIISDFDPVVGDSYNFVNISPLGNYVIVGYDGYRGDTYRGIVVYRRDFSNADSPLELVTKGGVHADVALTADGQEVIVYQQNIIDDGLKMTYLRTGESVFLMDWNVYPLGGVHIAGNCTDTPGWVLVSTYSDWEEPWINDQLFMLELKESPRIWRISDTYNEYNGNYNSEAFGSINKNGDKIIWAANWDNEGGTIDTYMADLPDSWHEELTPVVCAPDDFDCDSDLDGEDLAMLAIQVASGTTGEPEISYFANSYPVF